MIKTYIYISTVCIFILSGQYCKPKHSTSLKSRIIYTSLKSVNFSERYFNKLISKPRRKTGVITPGKFNRKLIVESEDIDGFKVYTVNNKSEEPDKHIIMLHGGAYVAEALKGHKSLMERFALSHSFRVSFIDYPLAPENNALTTIRMVEEAYRDIINSYPGDTVLLFGDSAGGGLALALLQVLRKKGDIRMPHKTALVSPWLDISMSNPDIYDYVDKDILINIYGLMECGRQYADRLDITDPIVSPLYGNMEGLSQIKIWVSDYELFYPDCILLNMRLQSASGSSSSISVKQKMIHDWIILPIRERDETIYEIADFFNTL